MSGSFLRQDLKLHRAVDQYIQLKRRMETNSLCVDVYEDPRIPCAGLFFYLLPPVPLVQPLKREVLLTAVLRPSQLKFNRADT